MFRYKCSQFREESIMATCLRCDKHVATGAACIVLEGDLRSTGEFVAKEAIGYLHTEHAEEKNCPIERESFPLVFAPID